SLVDNGNGTLTYTNESGSPVTIQIPVASPSKSAYEIWLDLPGNAGKTEADFIDNLKGSDGSGILTGNAAPNSSLGKEGDFYLDSSSYLLYGPKSGNDWGTGTSLKAT